jgi:hypothetical protein
MDINILGCYGMRNTKRRPFTVGQMLMTQSGFREMFKESEKQASNRETVGSK